MPSPPSLPGTNPRTKRFFDPCCPKPRSGDQFTGHGVYIISYREGQEEVENELREYGISFDEVILPRYEDLDHTGFYEWKAETCRRLEIDVFFEDMAEVINELGPPVVAFMPVDRELGRVTYVDEAR